MTSPEPTPKREPNPSKSPQPPRPVPPPRPTRTRTRVADNLTPEQRSLRSRLGAHVKWARCEDRSAATAAARANSPASTDRWEREVDPYGVLDPYERATRAEHAKKAHFTRMAMKSAQSRARRKRAA